MLAIGFDRSYRKVTWHSALVLDGLGWKAGQLLKKYQKELLKGSGGAFFPEVKADEEHFDEEFTEVREDSNIQNSMRVATHVLLYPTLFPLAYAHCASRSM
jgi:hypothetical protein